jgi:hypothetical protein
MQDAVCGVSRAVGASSGYFTDGGPALVARDGVLFPITAGERHNVSTRACVSRDGFVRVFLYLLGLRDCRLILLKLAGVEFYLRTKFGTR